MPLLSGAEREFARAVSGLAYCNPFLPERIRREQEALGPDFVESAAVWSQRPDVAADSPNLARIARRVETLATDLRERLSRGKEADAEDRTLYEDLVLYLLYDRHQPQLFDLLRDNSPGTRRVKLYRDFAADLAEYLGDAGQEGTDPEHVFACAFQIRRAFHHIYAGIVGGSMPTARLRATIWQSIFTHDMRRYRRSLYRHMGDITTLITGPSGTGKELVARAIGLSRYIPFRADTETLAEEYSKSFLPLNLSALSPTLIESELFGHRRGAFTGAVEDRPGWLEVCPALGTVFLDEIGDLDGSIQVKLLRTLESRTFERLGETKSRAFRGKIIAATHRDLAAAMACGTFREDFYYRLCSDMIVTPSLHQQIADSPSDLRQLTLFLANRIAGAEEAPRVAAEVEEWIAGNLPENYGWPGNVRELEQCVRNILIRREYRPPRAVSRSPAEALARRIEGGGLTAQELLSAYCTLVYRRTGSYVETARRLGLDRTR